MIEYDLFILEVTKIEEVVGKYIVLNKKGDNYLGICPFHDQNIPSFYVSSSKKIFKCFGCGRTGNSISFVSQFKKISYHNAINVIATTFNIKLPIKTILSLESDKYVEDSIISRVTKPILDNFNSHIESVKSLLNFDNIVLDFCITQVSELNERIRDNKEIKITNVQLLPEKTLQQLKSIRINASMHPQYKSIYNQCLVLIVSYFTSSVKELFRDSLQYYSEKKHEILKGINAELKFSFEELETYNFDLSKSVGEIIIRKKDISFQDMQSICREFNTYFGIKIEKNAIVDNIILSQASRHAIVHSLSLADDKFINQISHTKLRTIKPTINLNDELEFSPLEIEEVMNNMRDFLSYIECNL